VCGYVRDLCAAGLGVAKGADERGAGNYEAVKAARETVVARMVADGFTRERLQTLPFGVSLPLQQALRDCRAHPPGSWPAAAHALVGRDDLAALEPSDPHNPDGGARWRPPASLAALSCRRGDVDGLELVQEQTRLRFCRDRRMKEVCRLLRSSRPMRLRFERAGEGSDADFVQAQQQVCLSPLHHGPLCCFVSHESFSSISAGIPSIWFWNSKSFLCMFFFPSLDLLSRKATA
jgi:hypothetical protein